MKRLTIALGLSILAFPAAAQADPHPNNADFRDARAQCAEERGDTHAERAAFRGRYGSRPYARCVRRAAQDEHGERHRARVMAVMECRTERQDPEQFGEDYGAGRRAFGRCVATKASENRARFDERDSKAIERRQTPPGSAPKIVAIWEARTSVRSTRPSRAMAAARSGDASRRRRAFRGTASAAPRASAGCQQPPPGDGKGPATGPFLVERVASRAVTRRSACAI